MQKAVSGKKQKKIAGNSASPGLARGKLFVVDPQEYADEKQSPAKEREKLEKALNQTCARLRKMMREVSEEEAGILEFQAELAEDPSLVESVLVDIDGGQGALAVWRKAMDAQVKDYEEADDEYFKARAADLADLRDQVMREIAGKGHAAIPDGSLVHAIELKASELLGANWESGGVVMAHGSVASHVAMLARARKIPMVVGAGWHPEQNGKECMLDAEKGVLVLNPGKSDIEAYEKRSVELKEIAKDAAKHLHEKARTAEGERVTTYVNIASVEETKSANPDDCDGIGLARTEFLFSARLADEKDQEASYKSLVKWAKGKPVTIRTLDAGGDKPIAGYTMPSEQNPFLGIRGLRLSLRYPEVFAAQVRSILRASEEGPVKIMLPMVTVPSELEQAKSIIGVECKKLGVAKVPAIGMMVEVPASAMMIDRFDSDFFSIGSNDLMQYLSAIGRDSSGMDELADGCMPSLLELVGRVVEHGKNIGKEVSLCGELAGDPRFTHSLLDCGLRVFSMAPARLGEVKAEISKWQEP